MYQVKGFCAGILVFESYVDESNLAQYVSNQKVLLKEGCLSIRFALGVVQTIKEICIDVHEVVQTEYRPDLSVAYKY